MDLQRNRPSVPREMIPGRISTGIPWVSTPLRSEPPAIPPLSSSTPAPGLFTSKERIMDSLGGMLKSCTGTGMFFTIYSHRTSILYPSWVDIGMIGEFSALVPTILLSDKIPSYQMITNYTFQECFYALLLLKCLFFLY